MRYMATPDGVTGDTVGRAAREVKMRGGDEVMEVMM
jgi:hypothetical protein